MDKAVIIYFKRKFPKFFYRFTKSMWAVRAVSELDRFRYIQCMTRNKPYYGALMLSAQTWLERKPYMKKIIEMESSHHENEPLNILEIGSWAGESANLWADSIKKFNNGNGRVICIDPWEPYVNKSDNVGLNVAPLIMEKALKSGKIFKLFMHNIRTSGNSDIISPYKGYSNDLLPTFRDELFNIAFVDGAHYYSNMVQDLTNTAPLVKVGGVICGDDLELQSDEIDFDFAQKNKEKDMVIDPKTNKEYHPGVCLAVAKTFGRRIPSYYGFWAVRKTSTGWEDITIEL